VLADPKLELFLANTLVNANDNWGTSIATTPASFSNTFTQVGAFLLPTVTSRDAALLITLAPGSYTAQVSGVGNTTGVALVEIYEVP
jgi:hypothetical protein